MLSDDIDDKTSPPIEGKAPITLPLAIIFKEVTALPPILINAVHQFSPHAGIHLPDALVLPVKQSTRTQHHVIDGKPYRPTPIVVQCSVLCVRNGQRTDAALGKELFLVADDVHDLADHRPYPLSFFLGVELLPEHAGKEGKKADIAHSSDQLIDVLILSCN